MKIVAKNHFNIRFMYEHEQALRKRMNFISPKIQLIHSSVQTAAQSKTSIGYS